MPAAADAAACVFVGLGDMPNASGCAAILGFVPAFGGELVGWFACKRRRSGCCDAGVGTDDTPMSVLLYVDPGIMTLALRGAFSFV